MTDELESMRATQAQQAETIAELMRMQRSLMEALQCRGDAGVSTSRPTPPQNADIDCRDDEETDDDEDRLGPSS